MKFQEPQNGYCFPEKFYFGTTQTWPRNRTLTFRNWHTNHILQNFLHDALFLVDRYSFFRSFFDRSKILQKRLKVYVNKIQAVNLWSRKENCIPVSFYRKERGGWFADNTTEGLEPRWLVANCSVKLTST